MATLFLLTGEGVFGWAVYWPVLWFLLDWRYVYWLAFFLGFLLVGLKGLGIGWASFVLVVGVWLMSFLEELTKENGWLDVVAIVGVAFFANMLLGLDFSLVEAVAVGLAMLVFKVASNRKGDLRV